MLAIIEAAGFSMRVWNTQSSAASRAVAQTATIYRLVMGDGLDAILAAGQGNGEEGRMVSMEGVFDRL